MTDCVCHPSVLTEASMCERFTTTTHRLVRGRAVRLTESVRFATDGGTVQGRAGDWLVYEDGLWMRYTDGEFHDVFSVSDE